MWSLLSIMIRIYCQRNDSEKLKVLHVLHVLHVLYNATIVLAVTKLYKIKVGGRFIYQIYTDKKARLSLTCIYNFTWYVLIEDVLEIFLR